jgi:hypothetical protein
MVFAILNIMDVLEHFFLFFIISCSNDLDYSDHSAYGRLQFHILVVLMTIALTCSISWGWSHRYGSPASQLISAKIQLKGRI